MSEFRNILQASRPEPGYWKVASDEAAALATLVDGEPFDNVGMNKDGDLGGHTLLSRPVSPQGRRSLFRR